MISICSVLCLYSVFQGRRSRSGQNWTTFPGKKLLFGNDRYMVMVAIALLTVHVPHLIILVCMIVNRHQTV